jgi:hypothetical protein
MTQTSNKREIVPVVEEEEVTAKQVANQLLTPTTGTRDPRSLAPRRLVVPRSGLVSSDIEVGFSLCSV